MDDGDLGDNIQQCAEHAEAVKQSPLPKGYLIQNDEAHLEPSRWWFASSAFPMIAGTLGPVASAFSICALARPWRQHLIPGEDVTKADFVEDPTWLIAVNAVQLAVAVIANVFLLLNMARRVRFGIAQPITIVGWYTSAILLIGLVATAAGPLLEGLPAPTEQYIWSQAFYYGIWAAILYFTNSSLMVVTFWGAKSGRYDKDFRLTTSQRTLMLQTIMFLMYLLLGALVFSNIEGWNYLDGLYWADVTLFTVGFGDYSPSTNLGRALLIPYAFVGIISLGLVIASIRSMILERGRRRVDARVEEKKRRQMVRIMTNKGDDSILEPIKEEPSPSIHTDSQNSAPPANEFERRKAEFELMRKIQTQALHRRRWIAMGVAFGTWILVWLLGAYIFYKCEEKYQGWTYFESFYFCFTALTTIGYGDFTPDSPAGKSFFVFWSLLALPTMTVLISNAGDTVVKFVRDATLRLGNITILPGDSAVAGDLKHVISKLTFGKVFPDFHIFPKPPAPDFRLHIEEMSDTSSTHEQEQQTHQQQQTNHRDQSQFLDVERGRPRSDLAANSGRATSTFTSKVRRSLSRIRDPLEELPAGTEFHFLLISEIQVVSGHIRESPPHQYTFEEWAWYLRLIGEDERDPANHRKPRPKPKRRRRTGRHHHHNNHHAAAEKQNRNLHDEHDKNPAKRDAEKLPEDLDMLTWSWVGNRSPLMGSQEESEWILDRLTNRLRESLSAERRRQLNRKPRGTNNLARRLGVGAMTASNQISRMDGHHRREKSRGSSTRSQKDKEKEGG